ncbi:hypothetical protein M513_02772 [Trichuris suis]|uniref:Uncharacterized protein n=1 Tax=Trichuris suis TaxID=68888 RepID=A0A085MGH1_9BILA|nr:hypothetical protein M513_02772 [Trichuris suis]
MVVLDVRGIARPSWIVLLGRGLPVDRQQLQHSAETAIITPGLVSGEILTLPDGRDDSRFGGFLGTPTTPRFLEISEIAFPLPGHTHVSSSAEQLSSDPRSISERLSPSDYRLRKWQTPFLDPFQGYLFNSC